MCTGSSVTGKHQQFEGRPKKRRSKAFSWGTGVLQLHPLWAFKQWTSWHAPWMFSAQVLAGPRSTYRPQMLTSCSVLISHDSLQFGPWCWTLLNPLLRSGLQQETPRLDSYGQLDLQNLSAEVPRIRRPCQDLKRLVAWVVWVAGRPGYTKWHLNGHSNPCTTEM